MLCHHRSWNQVTNGKIYKQFFLRNYLTYNGASTPWYVGVTNPLAPTLIQRNRTDYHSPCFGRISQPKEYVELSGESDHL